MHAVKTFAKNSLQSLRVYFEYFTRFVKLIILFCAESLTRRTAKMVLPSYTPAASLTVCQYGIRGAKCHGGVYGCDKKVVYVNPLSYSIIK